MQLRRIRGVLTSALVWGGLGALGGSVLLSVMVLAEPHGGSLRELSKELLDQIPGFFGYTAAIGGFLALIVVVAERNKSIDTLTLRRFKLCGLVAGALVGLGVATRVWLGSTSPSHVPLISLALMILASAFAGGQGASLMLQAARRSGEKSRV